MRSRLFPPSPITPMRTLSFVGLALAFVLAGCDATAPSASADAAPAPYTIVGPSFVKAGECDTFTAQDASGNPVTVSDWTVSGSAYLTNETSTSAFVLAEYGGSSYTVKALIQGAWYSKSVRVSYNPAGTYEC